MAARPAAMALNSLTLATPSLPGHGLGPAAGEARRGDVVAADQGDDLIQQLPPPPPPAGHGCGDTWTAETVRPDGASTAVSSVWPRGPASRSAA